VKEMMWKEYYEKLIRVGAFDTNNPYYRWMETASMEEIQENI
jgi:hypothetical protein